MSGQTSINIAVIARDRASKELRGMGKQVQSFGKMAATALIGAAAATVAVIGGVNKLVSTTSNYADNIDKMSIRTGIARQALQELDFIVKQAGGTFDGIDSAISAFIRNLDQAKTPGSEVAETLNKLGLSIVDQSGRLRSMNDLFFEARQKISEIENPTERAQAAMALFGRSASDLLPLFTISQEEYRKLAEESRKLGLMTDDTIARFVTFGDRMSASRDAAGRLGHRLVAILLPELEGIANVLQNQAQPALNGFVSWLEVSAVKVRENVPGVEAVTKAWSDWIEAMVRFGPIAGTQITLTELFSAAWARAKDSLNETWTAIKTAAVEKWTAIKDWFTGVGSHIKDVFTDLVSKAVSWGSDVMQGFWNGLTGWYSRIRDSVTSFVNDLVAKVKSVLDIKSPSGVFADIGKNMALGLKEGFRDNLSGMALTRPITALPGSGGTSNSMTVNIGGGISPTDRAAWERELNRWWRKTVTTV